MGTNYYIENDFCEHCNRGTESYHIGKSSMGWCFSLHVDSMEGVNTLGDIIALINKPNAVIVDEYRQVISTEYMLKIITERSRERDEEKKPFGYDSWDEFHRLNQSEMGPNNMLRRKVDGGHCIAQGDGTYDLVTGEFC